MLEILGIIILYNKNAANAVKRGRNPAGFIGLTIGLWLGMELLGLYIGLFAGLGAVSYIFALVLAIIGGIISYVVSKKCKPGNYTAPAQQAMEAIKKDTESLSSPAQVTLIRNGSLIGALVKYNLTLNGMPIGKLTNNGRLTAETNQKKNILRAVDSYGAEVSPLVFDVENDAQAKIHFKANKFILEQAAGFQAVSLVPLAQSSNKKVKLLPKIFTIINLLVSVFLLIIPIPFMLNNGFNLSLLVPIIIGSVIISFSIPAAVSAFGKFSKYRKWLSVVMYVLFGFFFGSVLLTFIYVISRQ